MKGWFARSLAGASVLALLVGAAGVAAADTIPVDVQSNFFSPAEVFIATGDTVSWVFHDSLHTTTSVDGLWDSGLQSSGTFEFTFDQAGDYGYFCTLHLECCNMVGIVHVIDPVILAGSLMPTNIDPNAVGAVDYEMRPYRTTLSVAVGGITSTNNVDVFVNGNFVGTIALDPNGNGELDLNTQNGDVVPNLQAGDEIEIFDAVDDVTLILIGTVQ
jgi:plastocyanin